jgi:hypothetical protein
VLGVKIGHYFFAILVPFFNAAIPAVAMNQEDSNACSVLLIDDEPFAEDIISHGMKGCAAYALRYARDPGMAVELAK